MFWDIAVQHDSENISSSTPSAAFIIFVSTTESWLFLVQITWLTHLSIIRLNEKLNITKSEYNKIDSWPFDGDELYKFFCVCRLYDSKSKKSLALPHQVAQHLCHPRSSSPGRTGMLEDHHTVHQPGSHQNDTSSQRYPCVSALPLSWAWQLLRLGQNNTHLVEHHLCPFWMSILYQLYYDAPQD